MPKKLQKYFFSKFRKPLSSPKSPVPKSYSSPTCRILPRCRVPRTPSFSLERGGYVDDEDDENAAVFDKVDRLMFENFNSLYPATISEQGDEQRSRISSEPSRFKVPAGSDHRFVSEVDRFLLENPSSVCEDFGKNREKAGKQRSFTKPPRSIDSKTKAGADSNLLFVSDVDRFLLENFDSLFDQTNDGSEEEEYETGERVFFEPSRQSISSYPKKINDRTVRGNKEEEEEQRADARALFEPSRQSIDLQRDIDVSHSDRFFVAASRSSSLMEEAWLSLSSTEEAKSSTSTVTGTSEQEVEIPEDSVAVMTRSVDPYEDFRRSMKEMVEARLEQGEGADWDFMEELLFCYLNLNDKGSHRYILRAFADLVGGRVSGDNRDRSSFFIPEKGKVLLDSRFNAGF